MVTFMRYRWDDRFEMPPEALKPLFPPLAEGEMPSYDVHIAPDRETLLHLLPPRRQGKQQLPDGHLR